MNRFVERGGIWVAGQGALLAAVVVFGLLLPGTGPAVYRYAGGLLLLIAAGIAVAGAATLRRNLSPFPNPVTHAKLVQHGIYTRIRHPLYTSVILVAFGWALAWLSWPAALAAVALIPFFFAKSRREEERLCGRFPEYAEYMARTRRFLPWIY